MTDQPITYSQEVYRKLFHLSALIIPIAYAFMDRWVMLGGLLPITLIVTWMDAARHSSPFFQKLAEALFSNIMRPHEQDSERKALSGASHMLIAACACILILPKLIALTAFSVLIISDTAAALVGRKYGAKKLMDKSVEGTLAFIFSGIAVVVIIAQINSNYHDVSWEFYLAGIVAVIFGAYIELISSRMNWDDNFSIPISVGGMMLALGFLTGSYLGL